MLNEMVKNKILIFDGAMGTYINSLKMQNFNFRKYKGLNECLNIYAPELIEKIHTEYLKAGADIIETNTFNANPIVLAEYGLENQTEQINIAAVKIAQKAVSNFKNKFIAGSVGPTNVSLSLDSKLGFDEMKKSYARQILALVKSGVDILIFETAHDISNIKSGLISAFEILKKHKKNIQVIASITFDKNGFTLSGHNIQAAYAALEHFPLFAFGINCSTGPKDMEKIIFELSKISKFPVFVMPNAGLPDENGNYKQTPQRYSDYITNYAKNGLINIVGGCCGTTPKHIKYVSQNLKQISPRKIEPKISWKLSHIDILDFEKTKPPIIIGERNNSIGSKKFREIISNRDFDGAILIAKTQIEKGAQVLDICFANPERDEIEDAKLFLPLFAKHIKIPISIDTTNLEVAELACKIFSGKIIINSVNFESGIEKPLKAIELNRKYGAKIVFGLLDENKNKGLPLTCERKIEIAKRAYNFLVIKNKLNTEDLIFDALVLPVGIGNEYKYTAIETLNTIKKLKKLFPAVKTILGISNVSFGLPPKARDTLNSVFLNEAIKAGLDLAIINVERNIKYSDIPKNEIKLAKDLIFAKNENAASIFINYYKGKKEKTIFSVNHKIKPEEKIKKAILTGIKSSIKEAIDELLKIKNPFEIINGPVLKAMSEVGKLFTNGDLIVTEVLACAEVTKAIISYLAPILPKNKTNKRGKLLLATVRGDVHDIGKNLVKIIFESNGFDVQDLGIKVPPETIIKAVKKYKPDFIGLSGLLVRSTEEMLITAKELAKQNIRLPLLLGGAALTEKFVENKIIPIYNAPVFYSKDAMDGLNKTLSYISGNKEIQKHANIVKSKKKDIQTPKIVTTSLNYYPDKIPVPKDFKRKVIKNFSLEILFENINWAMFNFKYLKAKNSNLSKLEKTKKLIEEFKNEIIEKKLIKADGIYQFFKTNSHKNSIFIYDESKKFLEEFIFPRQNNKEFLSISDFILPEEKGIDYIAFFIISCGRNIKEISENYRKNGQFIKSYLLESLALSLAESFAEVIHRYIREDWGIAENTPLKELYKVKYQGKRFSFGYPSCPDLANQKKLFKLLKPQDIRITLTQNYMMEPETSISGFVLHNPKAKYFEI